MRKSYYYLQRKIGSYTIFGLKYLHSNKKIQTFELVPQIDPDVFLFNTSITILVKGFFILKLVRVNVMLELLVNPWSQCCI